jgi:small subunit ribosomal protein S6
MPLYDLMLLLDPGAPSDRQESILKDVQGLLESGGNVVGNYDWGSRRMTFEIDHRPDAAYHLFQFETESGGALLERVDHSLKIMDGVLRHRIIRLKDGSPPPPMPSPDRRGGYGDYESADSSVEVPAAAAAVPEAGVEAAPDAVEATPDAAVEAPAEPEAPAAPAEAEAAEPGVEPVSGDDEAPPGPAAA